MTEIVSSRNRNLTGLTPAQAELRLLAAGFLVMTLMSLALALSPMVRSSSWDAEFRIVFLIPLAAWTAGAGFLHIWLKRILPEHDPAFLPVVMLLTGWGLLVIWRLAPSAGLRQTIWLILGVATAAFIIRFSSFLDHLQEYRLVWLISGLLLTGLTLLFGTNPSGSEPNLWFRFLGVYFQPSEPLRLILVIYLAAYYARRLDLHWKLSSRNLNVLTPVLIIFGISISLLILQRDLGTAILFAAVLTLMLYLATHRTTIIITAGIALMVSGVLGFLLYDVVQVRITAWLLPWQDPSGSSYQIVQALIAFASGGIFGSGPGLGSPGFVPAAHTDFIYTAIGEEFGLIGIILLITLYMVLLSRGLKTSTSQQEPFTRMLTSGITITLGLQALLIMGGNVRLLPLTGVTLPFMSYGGSSLLTSFAGFGILVSLSSHNPSREIQPQDRTVHLGMMTGFVLLAFFTSLWSVFRAPALAARADNFRGFVESRFQERGAILDHKGRVLVSTNGEPGSFRRTTAYSSFSPLIGYNSNQLGQSGLEQSLDPFLRGQYGYSEKELVWSYLLDSTSPGGLDVRLTLDLELQEAIHEHLGDRPGAVVFLNSHSGDLYALVSSPSYDINSLEDEWQQLLLREDAPLLNRPVQGSYQPGTILNPLLLAWQIESGQSTPGSVTTDYNAPILIEEMQLTCARSTIVRPGDLISAVRAGCPAAALEIGESIGTAGLSSAFSAFGLTDPLLLRLPIGQLRSPDPGNQELSLETASTGQGTLTVSPLHVARATAALQTGSLPALRLVSSVRLPDGSWENLEALGKPVPVLSQASVEEFQAANNLHNSEFLCFSGQAVTGSDMNLLAWVSCLVQKPSTSVLTLVMEDANPADAFELAYSILSLPALP